MPKRWLHKGPKRHRRARLDPRTPTKSTLGVLLGTFSDSFKANFGEDLFHAVSIWRMAVGDASGRPDPPSTWAEGALRVTRRPDTLCRPTATRSRSVVTS